MQPQDRATKFCLTYLSIYMYVCIRLAFSVELRLRVSRLLRSLINNESHEEDHEGSLLHTPQDSKGG